MGTSAVAMVLAPSQTLAVRTQKAVERDDEGIRGWHLKAKMPEQLKSLR